MQNRTRPAAWRLCALGAGMGLALGTLVMVAPESAAGEPTIAAGPALLAWGAPAGESATAADSTVETSSGSDAPVVVVAPTGTGEQSTTAVPADPTTTESATVDPVVAAVGQAPVSPQLSIAIDNGRTSTTIGDILDYVITVQNLGTADVDGLFIAQSVPSGLDFGTADAGGTADASAVAWNLDLKATTTATFHTTMTVTATPAELLRLASVVCARTTADGPPIVCATHSDQLPAGAAAEAALAALSGDAATPESGTSSWWYLGGGIGLVVVIAALAVLLVRRRTASPTEGA